MIVGAILAALVVGIGEAASQEQEPQPQMREGHQIGEGHAEEAVEDQREPEEGHAYVDDAIPAAVHDVDSAVDANSGAEASEDSYQESGPENSFWQRILTEPLALFTLAIAAFTAFLAVFTGGLWAVSILTARRQLRAYVVVSAAKAVNTSKVPAFNIHIRNCGQTPAYDVRWRATIIPLAEGDEFSLEGNDAVLQPTLGPGQEYTRSQWSIDLVNWIAVAISLTGGSKSLYAFGNVTYRDTFGRRRFTRYRMRLPVADGRMRDRDFVFCCEGNEAN
jgi:hypothetical protein